MPITPLITLLALLAILSGCAQLDDWTSTITGRGTPAIAEAEGIPQADVIYVNIDAAAASRDLRNVYIAPANLANMQVIQPEGEAADVEWWVDDNEDKMLQQAIAGEFAAALGYKSAFYIVATPQEAQIVVNTAIVAVHPNVARSAVAARTSKGGAITVSIALANAANGAVLVRVVDTKSTDDIWAFNEVLSDNPARNQIFRAWGDSVRLGLLQLQGRSQDPVLMAR